MYGYGEVMSFTERSRRPQPTKRPTTRDLSRPKHQIILAFLALIALVVVIVLILRAYGSVGSNEELDNVMTSEPTPVLVIMRVAFDGYEGASASPLSLHVERSHGESEEYSADILAEEGGCEPLWLMPGTYRVTGNTVPVMNDGSIFADVVDQEFVVEPGFSSTSEIGGEAAATQLVSISLQERKDPIGISDEQLEDIRTKLITFGIGSEYVDIVLDAKRKESGQNEERIEEGDRSKEQEFEVNRSLADRAAGIVGFYEKEWPSEGAEYNPSYSVHIYSVEGDKVRLAVDKVARNLSFLVGTGSEDINGIYGTMDENGVIHFSYVEDGWLGRGYGTIEVQGDQLIVDVVATYTDYMARPGATLDTNGPLTLKRTPFVQR